MELAVLDPEPLFRLGILASLSGGREFATPDGVLSWLTPDREATLVLTVPATPGEPDGPEWALLLAAQQCPQVKTVALLSPYSVTSAARALSCGAVHVAPHNVEAQGLREVIAEVKEGLVRVAVPVIVALAATGRPHRSVAPSDTELGWLRDLGRGATVEAVAARAGLSERMLYRRLQRLYQQLGVSNRTQALMLGRDEGWF